MHHVVDDRPVHAGYLSKSGVVTMVIEDKLSSVLIEFARTLVTDFPIQGILDHLVGRIVEVLPVTSAGVTLITEGRAPRYVAASGAAALRFEKLQTELGEGPCRQAYDSGHAVAIPDLSQDVRFPRFTPAAMTAGLAAVFTFPLTSGDRRIGALDLYSDQIGALSAHDMEAAKTLSDVAAAYLQNAQSRDDEREASDHFHHSSLHDPLTELPNRLLLQQRLEHAARRAQRSNANAAVLFADLDRFKQINDMHGHVVGDELLIAVARRLAALVRPGDTLARVSGDEFVFLCEDLANADDVEILARRVDDAFAKPFVLNDLELSISASVGMAFAGRGEEISNQLVEKADIAMYQAKRCGGAGHQIIDLRDVLRLKERNDLESDLRIALTKNRLEVAYQPIIRVADDVVVGVEALLRWTDTNRGAVSPASMVNVAEQSTLITDLGAWILRISFQDRSKWMNQHPGTYLDLAVNVSPRQLLGPNFCVDVEALLAETGMDPKALVLELTESIFIDDVERSGVVLARLTELGIRVAMDDFGTGYSSLSYLRRLPIEIIKIDQSFIADIGHGPNGGAIVAAVTNLAHALGLEVSAEGVENQTQRDEIRRIGCDVAQGFFYARPMTALDISTQMGDPSAAPMYLSELPDSVRITT